MTISKGKWEEYVDELGLTCWRNDAGDEITAVDQTQIPAADVCEQCGSVTQLTHPSARPAAPDHGRYECPDCGHVQKREPEFIYDARHDGKIVGLYHTRADAEKALNP